MQNSVIFRWTTRRQCLVVLLLCIVVVVYFTINRDEYKLSEKGYKVSETVRTQPVMNFLNFAAPNNVSLVNTKDTDPPLRPDLRPQSQLAHMPKAVEANVPVTSVAVFNAEKEEEIKRQSVSSSTCVTLIFHYGRAPICIYPLQEDKYISASLARTGQWEGGNMNLVAHFLAQSPSMTLLDLGCNIGVYTIMAASLGHKAVSVDASRRNLRLLSKSLNIGKITENVTIVWNAVADIRGSVSLQDYAGNVGGTFVKPISNAGTNTVDDEHLAVAILLDDLSYLFGKEPVFIKMDIETFEWNALKGGEHFFSTVDVRYVFMEWVAHRKVPERATKIITFMAKFGLLPHTPTGARDQLDVARNATWSGEVLWVKHN